MNGIRAKRFGARRRAAWMLEIENAIDTVKYVGAAWRFRARESCWFRRQMLAWKLELNEDGRKKITRRRVPAAVRRFEDDGGE